MIQDVTRLFKSVTILSSLPAMAMYFRFAVSLKKQAMGTKETSYNGILKAIPQFKIYLNLDSLQKGNYTLFLTYKDKTIKKFPFKM